MKKNRPIWFYNESIQVGVDYTNEHLVAEYDKQHEGFRNFAKEAMKIAAVLGLSKRSSIVLDIGCGTGGLTTHLAKMCKYVYAVDVSGVMLATLTHKIQNQGLKNIRPVQSGFLTYEHGGEAFDGIVANINLHHLPDFWKQIALCRLYNLLKPGGKLFLADVVFGFNPKDYQDEINSWLDSMEKHAGPQMADETVIHVKEEFSTWEWIMVGLLERAGFLINDEFEIMPHIRAYICTKQ
jgi:putative AdoMet-dependent methyltransferase